MNRQFDTKDTGVLTIEVCTRASRRFYGDNLESTVNCDFDCPD